MRRIFLSACLVLLTGASVARAQECDRSDDSQQMMNICAGEDYQAADARLNAAYGDLISSDVPMAEIAASGAASLDRLPRRRMRAPRLPARAAPSYAMEVSQCLTRLTNERIKQLAASANCEERRCSCTNSDEDSDEVQ